MTFVFILCLYIIVGSYPLEWCVQVYMCAPHMSCSVYHPCLVWELAITVLRVLRQTTCDGCPRLIVFI